MKWKYTQDEIIQKANEVHNNYYDYSLLKYVNMDTPVEIICPEHGVFEKKPHYHINAKVGCPVCMSIKLNNYDHNLKTDSNYSYMIGLFQTDGSMGEDTRNRGGLSLEISRKDEDIIYKLKNIIPYNSTVVTGKYDVTITNKSGKKYEYHDVEGIGLYVYNKYFRDFLYKYGVPYGRKSKTVSPPLLINDLSKIDYVRGLIDGDGSLGFTKDGLPFVSFVTISTEMANFLTDIISEITGKPKKETNPNTRDKAYNIMILKEDAVIFCEKVYYDNCLSIDRKYNISKEIRKWVRPPEMKKVWFERRKWIKEEDEYIKNHTIEESMEKLERTETSIEMRLYRLKNNFLY